MLLDISVIMRILIPHGIVSDKISPKYEHMLGTIALGNEFNFSLIVYGISNHIYTTR